MSDVTKLAKQKIELQNRLTAISMCNVYGKSNDDQIALMVDKIETMKKLNEVNRDIDKYTGDK